MDGTLIDLKIDWEAIRRDLQVYLGENYGIKTDLTYLDTELDGILEKLGDEASRGAYKIVEYHELENLHAAKPIKETVELVKQMKKEGKRLAILSSNTKKTIEKSLTLLGIKEYFDLIIAKEDVVKHKPNPEGLEKIVRKLNLSKHKTIYIGNSQKDMKTGKRAGIKTILVSNLQRYTK